MGVVLSGYDPELERKVALKFIKSQAGGQEAARTRLQREAQALAKLDHPNVVTVYDVGVHRGRLFVGMEFVEGNTLKAWMRSTEQQRTWKDVLKVFSEAGRGLAAAHAAGMVHRDFKPENVMLGDDGRVRVMDFGLVKAAGQEGEEGLSFQAISDTLEAGEKCLSRNSLTRTGTLLGTPAYMSPEQIAGGSADARSDQFSFCVALYEALYGERPFSGENLGELGKAILSRDVAPASRWSDVPCHVRKALLRGLEPHPDARWATMTELLVALSDSPRRSWRSWLAPIAAAAAISGSVWGFTHAGDLHEVCSDGEEMLAGIWDEGAQRDLRARTLASNLPYAEQTWRIVADGFDDWSESWRAARLQACQATRLRGEQTADVLELRLACLDRQLVRFETSLGGLRKVDLEPGVLLDRLVEQREWLPSPERCDALSILEGGGGDSSGELAADDARGALLERIAGVEGLLDAASYGEAIEQAERVVSDARLVDDEALEAEALRILGTTLHARGRSPERAKATLREAALLARRSRAERVFVEAATVLVGEYALSDVELAKLWSELARIALEELGGDLELEVGLGLAIGDLAMVEGNYELALVHHRRVLGLVDEKTPSHLRALRKVSDDLREIGRFEEARELLEQGREQAIEVWGPKHPDVARTLVALANVLAEQSRFGEALEFAQRSLAISEEIHGPSSLEVARTLNSIAIIHDEAGRYGAAVRTLERARAIMVRHRGEAHPDVAVVEVNIGSAKQNLARYDEAIEHYELAREILSESLGGEHVSVGVCLQNIGASQVERGIWGDSRGDLETGLASLDQAEPLFAAVYGLEHPAMAALDHNRAVALGGLRRYDEALAAELRSLAIKEHIHGDDHVELVGSLASLSAIELARGEEGRALALASRGISLCTEGCSPSEFGKIKLAFAAARFGLAGADMSERSAARKYAREAMRQLEDAEGAALARHNIARWLKASAH
ncbi:serine/threonine protein kinase [Pseudenhygromyxa sp. WMMC2535]|nr:serine/threonine protein kinase [Pseudenhygromyxa sp. WMMC2535]